MLAKSRGLRLEGDLRIQVTCLFGILTKAHELKSDLASEKKLLSLENLILTQ